ncbi:MAG: hypothetical protein LUH36_09885 [Oscillospiraceae bacterium]|nr:hypothetical protein [Oscillospiraceae bacterium]
MDKIIQIIPAPAGMETKYTCQRETTYCPVVCLALVEREDGSRYIELVDMDVGDDCTLALDLADRQYLTGIVGR